MSLLTSDGLLADRAGTSNDSTMLELGDAKDVNNQIAEETNPHANSPDLGSTDSEESTHAKEHKAKQEDHRKRKRDNPSKLEKDLVHSEITENSEITEKAPGKADLPKVTAVQSPSQNKGGRRIQERH